MSTLPLKPFDEMTDADYAEIGFMCGLEVHQQLLTRTKLFCRCPAGMYSSDYDAEVLRHMRPTLSEMGEYDGTALMEKKTRKNITYRLHQATVCTYEFDDTPPFPINDEAVDIALELSLLLRLNLVNELHIARKQYLDGSIPTGFQRTTLLGVDGWIMYGDRRINVRQLGLEEDSCREVADLGHERTYITDRLGMPLIEVVTEPEMYTPRESAEVCNVIRKLCRSTQKVRRGYGATRQDVNVSVRGGTRVEIKGVPQIWRIPHLVYNEARRQVALLRIRDELNSRGVTDETLQVESKDVTALLEKSSFAPVRKAIDSGLQIHCVLLPGFNGLLTTMTQEHTIFAKEFSDRIRVIACLSDLPNMVHSDIASDSLWPQDWQKLRKRMHATDRDTMIVVWGDELDLQTACEEIAIRAHEATCGVPSDTRQPLKDGTNGFERVLPGADRMYPDTDLPPIGLTEERIAAARSILPEYVWDTEARYRDAGMVPDDADRLCISPHAPLISHAITTLGVSPVVLGVALSQRWRYLKRAGLEPERLHRDALAVILEAHASGQLTRGGVYWMMEQLLKENAGDQTIGRDIAAAFLQQNDLRPATDQELDGAITREIGEIPSALFPTTRQRERFIIGKLIHGLIGRVDGARLTQLVHERLNPTVETTNGQKVQA